MNTMLIFIDAATSPQRQVAVGASLYLNKPQLESYTDLNLSDLQTKLANRIIYHKYQSKKSTWSEIKTAIDSLNFLKIKFDLIKQVEIYTDCQSLCDLLGKRKEKLIKNNFMTRTGKVLQNVDIYKELYSVAQLFEIRIYKIKGHISRSAGLSLQERIFSVVDKLSRKRLRAYLNDSESA